MLNLCWTSEVMYWTCVQMDTVCGFSCSNGYSSRVQMDWSSKNVALVCFFLGARAMEPWLGAPQAHNFYHVSFVLFFVLRSFRELKTCTNFAMLVSTLVNSLHKYLGPCLSNIQSCHSRVKVLLCHHSFNKLDTGNITKTKQEYT
jgi:hypothetical protein